MYETGRPKWLSGGKSFDNEEANAESGVEAKVDVEAELSVKEEVDAEAELRVETKVDVKVLLIVMRKHLLKWK